MAKYVITAYGEMDDDDFCMAELRGHRGLVPSNFLTDAPTPPAVPCGVSVRKFEGASPL